MKFCNGRDKGICRVLVQKAVICLQYYPTHAEHAGQKNDRSNASIVQQQQQQQQLLLFLLFSLLLFIILLSLSLNINCLLISVALCVSQYSLLQRYCYISSVFLTHSFTAFIKHVTSQRNKSACAHAPARAFVINCDFVFLHSLRCLYL